MNFGWYLEQFSFKGRPVSGGTVEFFVGGSTTTPKNVWYDVDNTVIAPNPITLDASGTMPQIYPESGLYLIVLRDASGAILYTRDNVSGNEGGATDADLRRFYSWFMMDSSYTGTPPDEDRTKITVNDVQTMLEFGYCCTGNTQTTSTTTTSLWYVKAYDATNDIATWKEVIVDIDSEVINLDRGNCNYLLPHPDRFSTSDQNFTTYPAGLYTLVKDSADGFYWKPQVVKEYPEPTYSVSGALIYDASLHAYRWIGIDEIGGKVKVDSTDSTAGYLSDKLIADTDPKGKETIVFTKHGNDGSNKTYGAMVDVNNVYDEILDKMNPPSYDLFGSYPDEVGVCQLTGIGASLKAKTLKDQSGNNLAWNRGTGENGANYGRGCVPGYAYVVTATGSQVQRRVWCAFGSTGEIYNSFDRYQTTTRDTSLMTADSSAARIPQGNASCAAYIKDGSDYYWMYGGFVDNYVYLLHDIPANYNDDGTFKSVGWVWTACPDLPKNVSHICSVSSGGFLYAGYQLGGIKYKPSIAGAGVMGITNQPRTNADLVRVVTGDGVTTIFAVPCLAHQSYNSPSATAIDSSSTLLPVTSVVYDGNTNSFNVQLTTAPASGLSVTLTVSSYQFNASYDGAGFSGVGSDHYGTYNTIDRDTGRIWTNTSEATTGTFRNSHVVGSNTVSDWTLLDIFVRNSSNDSYPTAKSDRLGTSYGTITSDPYTWWSSIQSAYGLWVATVDLKQIASDPIYAYSDDGIHWTKYTDGVGTGTGSTLAIWDSQSDGMNWFVTNMYASSPLIFELLVDSIPSHKRLVAEKGLGVSGDAFLVDLPNAGVLGTDVNGKLIISSGSSIASQINLDDLANVLTTGKTDGQVLTWINSAGKWEARNGGGGGGSSISVVDTYPKASIQSPIVLSPNQWTVYWTGFDLEASMTLSATSKFTAILGQAGSSGETFHFMLGKYDPNTSTYITLAYSNNISILTPGFITGLCDSLSTTLSLNPGRYYLGFVTNSTGISIAGFSASSLFNDISPYFLSLKKDNITSSTVPTSFTSVSETLTRYFIKLEA